jgi:hypothetical protein
MQRAEDENRERSGDDNEDSDEDEGKNWEIC